MSYKEIALALYQKLDGKASRFDVFDEVHRELLILLKEEYKNNKNRMAKRLGMRRAALAYILRKFDLYEEGKAGGNHRAPKAA